MKGGARMSESRRVRMTTHKPAFSSFCLSIPDYGGLLSLKRRCRRAALWERNKRMGREMRQAGKARACDGVCDPVDVAGASREKAFKSRTLNCLGAEGQRGRDGDEREERDVGGGRDGIYRSCQCVYLTNPPTHT